METTGGQPGVPELIVHLDATSVANGANRNETRETTTVEADEEHVNDYVLEKELGKGTFAAVMKVRDRRTGKYYAMKQVDKKFLRRRAGYLRLPSGGGAMGRPPFRGPPGMGGPGGPPQIEDPMNAIRREIAIMKKLFHPNVIRLVEVLDSEESPNLFMVMELAEGGPVMTLDASKQVDPLPQERAHALFRQLLLGLDYLHQQHIAHRDLKPENLLLHQDGRLLITDFGVSETYSSSDTTAKKAGSPAFMAPEVFIALRAEGTAYSAFKADVWSLGVCLFCFVSGRVPFVGIPDGPTLEEAITTAELQMPSDLEHALQDLLRRLLTKDPGQRITLEDAFVHPWVTQGGQSAMPTNTAVVQEVTDEEVNNSISHIVSFRTMMRVYQAIRKFARVRQNSDAGSRSGGTSASRDSLNDNSTELTSTASAENTQTT